jgi:hypothetical protein
VVSLVTTCHASAPSRSPLVRRSRRGVVIRA